ncbi:MAG: APC family permease [Candidatus Moduliflexus flocculans]|nr:APC family permease [Candidatus Moduliflexus flocculans]
MQNPIPRLSLFDAVNISLGSIIGAGIFVILGAAAAVSGPGPPWFRCSSPPSFPYLTRTGRGRARPEVSEERRRFISFARETLSDFSGFLVGWIWLFLEPRRRRDRRRRFRALPDRLLPRPAVRRRSRVRPPPPRFSIHLLGAKETSRLNNVLVMFKIAILLFFATVAFLHFRTVHFALPTLRLPRRVGRSGDDLLRVRRLRPGGHRCRRDRRPAAERAAGDVDLHLHLHGDLYSRGCRRRGRRRLQGPGRVRVPLADAIAAMGMRFGAGLVAAGGLAAAGTVVLASVLGLSRLAQIMARDGELPRVLAAVSRRTGAPRNAVLFGGAAMLILVFLSDLPHIAYISSFSLLLYYAAMNLSRAEGFQGPHPLRHGSRLSCLVLMVSLPILSWGWRCEPPRPERLTTCSSDRNEGPLE